MATSSNSPSSAFLAGNKGSISGRIFHQEECLEELSKDHEELKVNYAALQRRVEDLEGWKANVESWIARHFDLGDFQFQGGTPTPSRRNSMANGHDEAQNHQNGDRNGGEEGCADEDREEISPDTPDTPGNETEDRSGLEDQFLTPIIVETRSRCIIGDDDSGAEEEDEEEASSSDDDEAPPPPPTDVSTPPPQGIKRPSPSSSGYKPSPACKKRPPEVNQRPLSPSFIPIVNGAVAVPEHQREHSPSDSSDTDELPLIKRIHIPSTRQDAQDNHVRTTPPTNSNSPQTRPPRTHCSPSLTVDEDANCAVCNDPEQETGNAILFCDKCNVPVHQACYGVQSLPTEDTPWFCNPCAEGLDGRRVSCRFCPIPGGAMKPIRPDFHEEGESPWGHCWCALWIPGPEVESKLTQEPILFKTPIHPDRKKLVCTICKIPSGAPIQCDYKKCKTAFHPSCAQQQKYRLDRIDVPGHAIVDLKAYCQAPSHQPKPPKKGPKRRKKSGLKTPKKKVNNNK